MKNVKFFRWVAGVLMLAQIGCFSRNPPPRLYLLNPLPRPAESSPAAGSEMAVGIGPLTLPEHLKRPQIITRAGCGAEGEVCGELRLAELDRWAEPLEENIARVVAENLSTLLRTERIERYPFRPAAELEYAVRIDVIRFGADPSPCLLETRWSVLGPSGEVLHLSRSCYREAPGAGYGALVAALSRGLGELSREIAAVLEGRPSLPVR